MRCNGLSVAPLFYAIMRLEGGVVFILYIRLKTLSSQSLWLKRKKTTPHTLVYGVVDGMYYYEYYLTGFSRPGISRSLISNTSVE